MFHDGIQTQQTNNWKRTTSEHPIDRIFTTYFNTKQQRRNSQSTIRSNNYKSETKHIIQRQRVIRSFLNKPDEIESSIRKSIALNTEPKALSITSIPSPSLLPSPPHSNEQSINNNNRQQVIKKELDRQSPLFIRRHRPTIENLSPNQQTTDITNVLGNQLSLTIPQHFVFRNKSSRIPLPNRSFFKRSDRISSPRLKSSLHSKTTSEIKRNTSHFLPTPIWTPTLTEQDITHTRTLSGIVQSKLLRNRRTQKLQTEKINIDLKTIDIQDLHISPRSLNNPQNDFERNKSTRNKQFIGTEWKDSKSDEPVSTDGNSSTCDSQTNVRQNHSSTILSDRDETSSFTDISQSPTPCVSTKRSQSRRRAYHLALPPVTEHVDDNGTEKDRHRDNNLFINIPIDMKKILEKIYALQNEDFQFEDEDSLTFQLLNQQETNFEKNLSKLTKFQRK